MKTRILTAFAAGVIALSASAQNYKVVVTTTDGEKIAYETENVSSIRFENSPNYIEANNFYKGEYSTRNGLGIYYIAFGTSDNGEYGDPTEVGDIVVSLELISDLSEDKNDAKLPAGYYRTGSGASKWEFNVQQSGLMIRVDEGDEGVVESAIVDGLIDVKSEGEMYDIKAEFVLFTGENVAVSYEGPMTFVPGFTENDGFKEDQNITFEGAQMRYFANWFYPLCDDLTLELYTGEFAADGSQIEGFWFNCPIFQPKAKDPHNPEQWLADGVYTLDPRDSEKLNGYTQLPYTFAVGEIIDFWGALYPAGTYVTYLDKNGIVKQAFISDGTITVSENATKIELDLVAEDGIKITGTYQGDIILDDRSHMQEIPAIEGTITDDVVADFVPGTVAMGYPEGDNIKAGVYMYQMMITEETLTKGDYLQLTLAADEPYVLPDGTYTINNEIAPFGGIKGYFDYGIKPIFSWFSNLEDVDDEGVQNIVAPIMGGTVTISTTAENTRKIVLDLEDEDGHKITGEYEGLFIDLPADFNMPAKSPFKKGASKVAAPEKKRELPVRVKL